MSGKLSGCPGQDPAYLKDFNTNIVPCPRCGHEIEFFSDERKVRCPECSNNVFRIDPGQIRYEMGKIIFESPEASCLEWCGGCVDAKDYSDIKENNKRIQQKNEDFKNFIKSVNKDEVEVIEFFIDAYKKSINGPNLIDRKIFEILAKADLGLFLKARDRYLSFSKNRNNGKNEKM